MAILDMIIETDSELNITNIKYIGKAAEAIKNEISVELLNNNVYRALEIPDEPNEGIVVIDNKFFKYYISQNKNGVTVYLSSEAMVKDYYEQAIQQIPEGIQIWDRNGFFVHGNSASEFLEQYSMGNFKGKHLLDIYDLKEDVSTVLTVLRTDTPVINRCDRFKMRSGKTLTTINSGYPLRVGGKLYGAVVFESDLSALKQIKSRVFTLENYVEGHKKKNDNNFYNFNDIIHTSEKMEKLIHFSKKVSLTDSSVLITGDTGTGKELMAQSIHTFSNRCNKPFIDVNCSAVPSNLFESMFFGIAKGAFTGSMPKEGFFEMAEGGSLFLDEINSMNMDMQAKLLRVLQEKRFRRIGGSEDIKCDVRIIAASNEDLFQLMRENKVRKDFYYRIAAVKIHIPSLKERKEDILVLVESFLDILTGKDQNKSLGIDKDVLKALLKHDWPGNIRELYHALEYAFNYCPEGENILKLECFPDYLSSYAHSFSDKGSSDTAGSRETFKYKIEEAEKLIIKDVLEKHGYNITKSAKELDISRQSLQYRIRKLNILNN